VDGKRLDAKQTQLKSGHAWIWLRFENTEIRKTPGAEFGKSEKAWKDAGKAQY
jgi:hypothetical protein